MFHYAYRIEHPETRRFYVGVRSCRCDPTADLYWGSGTIIRRAVAKHGPGAFTKAILATFLTRTEAEKYEAEVVTIELLAEPLCMNLVVGGAVGVLGLRHTEDSRSKMSKSCKGRKISPEARKAISDALTGIKRTDATKARMSKAQKGHPTSDEQRAKLRKAWESRPPIPPEVRAKMAASRKLNPPMSQAVKDKIAAAHRGVPASEEAKAKLRAAWVRRKARMVEAGR